MGAWPVSGGVARQLWTLAFWSLSPRESNMCPLEHMVSTSLPAVVFFALLIMILRQINQKPRMYTLKNDCSHGCVVAVAPLLQLPADNSSKGPCLRPVPHGRYPRLLYRRHVYTVYVHVAAHPQSKRSKPVKLSYSKYPCNIAVACCH